MGHVVRETGWCSIDINTATGQIFLQERWLYNWIVQPPLAEWTLAEKRNFHNTADRAIWRQWSNHCKMGVSGTSGFAKRFGTAMLPINLDIKWVLTRPHWTVTVKKIPANQFEQSEVHWTARTIELDSNDINLRDTSNATTHTTQTPVAHEFGHTIGNTAVLNRGDEYRATSPHSADRRSIMNVGHGLRRRHFRTIIEEMNRMIPGTTFFVRSL